MYDSKIVRFRIVSAFVFNIHVTTHAHRVWVLSLEASPLIYTFFRFHYNYYSWQFIFAHEGAVSPHGGLGVDFLQIPVFRWNLNAPFSWPFLFFITLTFETRIMYFSVCVCATFSDNEILFLYVIWCYYSLSVYATVSTTKIISTENDIEVYICT